MLQAMEEGISDTQEKGHEKAPQKAPQPGTWKKGQSGRIPAGPPEPEDESIPELLRDLRHVRTKKRIEDRTPSRKNLRALAEKDYGKFLAMWKEEEKLFREASKPAEQAAGPVDVGSGKCLELIDRLLSDFEGGAR